MRNVLWGVVALVVALAGVAEATPITGTLNITGTVRLTSQGIDFLPAGSGTGSWSADAVSQTGFFASVGGTSGLIQDLSAANTTVGSAISKPGFITFAASPGTQINLTFIDSGVFGSALFAAAPAPGQVATPPAGLGNINTMYNMVNLPGPNTIFSFSVAGSAVNGADVTPMTGGFTLQFPGMNYQNVWATLSGGGSVTTSYSASFTVVPEPATLMLLAGASVLLTRVRRSRAAH